jgi:hypothetical protein
MLDKLKADFDGILELVNKTPQALQETAPKMILEQWFANIAPNKLASPVSIQTATPSTHFGSRIAEVPGRIDSVR